MGVLPHVKGCYEAILPLSREAVIKTLKTHGSSAPRSLPEAAHLGNGLRRA